ncbi:MAG: energy transducer TonB, partial [Sphingomonas bacterium]|nr:energy transducer TonB [Sphingomonas bacterium]
MDRLSAEPGDRLKSALAVTGIHALIGYALLRGLGVSIPPVLADAQQLIAVTLDPPPPPNVPAPPDTQKERAVAKPKDPEGAASPANRKDTPTEVVAPVPEIRLPPPPAIATAPIAGQGNAAAAGAAVLPGPGTGAGGIGTGLGSGRYGNGTGGGGGGRGASASYLRGGIDPGDYPRRAVERRAQGTTYLRFTILPNGRVRECIVTRSSGHRDLDAATCPLLERS